MQLSRLDILFPTRAFPAFLLPPIYCKSDKFLVAENSFKISKITSN